jgi:hypothetical protein
MESGRVRSVGPHAELLIQDAVYAPWADGRYRVYAAATIHAIAEVVISVPTWGSTSSGECAPGTKRRVRVSMHKLTQPWRTTGATVEESNLPLHMAPGS